MCHNCFCQNCKLHVTDKLNPSQSMLSLLRRLPVGRGGVINSLRFCFVFFSVSKVGAPLMGDTAVQSCLSHDF